MEPITIPELETERTLMRAWRQSDLEPFSAWRADPEVSRFVGGPLDRDQSWRAMATYLGHWQLRGYGTWAVQSKADGQLLGRAGLWNPEGWPGIEIGWTFKRDAWGHGYAQETARAAIAWTWQNIEGMGELISVIDPRNTASIRVAERIGMRFDREHLLHGTTPVQIYVISRP